MDSRFTMSVAMGMIVLMVAMRGERVGSADDCISKIVSCQQFINSTTKPTNDCCVPLLDVINNDVECLCNVLKSDIIKSLNFTMEQALALPGKCGQPVTNNACAVGAPSSTPAGKNTPPPEDSSTIVNRAAAISVSTLVAMAMVAFLLDALH